MKVTQGGSHAVSNSRQREFVALSGRAGAVTSENGEGKVWLIGAGPGDPELLTRKAARILELADVVVHDRLIGVGILDLAAPTARRLYVGKRKSCDSVAQSDLNDLLVALSREGLQVVRLKGGDPFMFGRGGEELLACRTAGVHCEVVPGIGAALAAAASARALLTHRGMAQAVTFFTGHAAIATDRAVVEPDLDWRSVARPNKTVAVYMGLSCAALISTRLVAAGRAPSTPVLAVEHASLSDERRILTTLATLPDLTEQLAGPAILLIGEVAALAAVAARAVPARTEEPVPVRSCP